MKEVFVVLSGILTEQNWKHRNNKQEILFLIEKVKMCWKRKDERYYNYLRLRSFD